MAKLQYITLAVLSLLAISLYNYDQKHQINHQDLFDSWLNLHGRHYETIQQRNYRMSVWMKNFEEVQKHNTKFLAGEQTYQMEMNHFADLKLQEFAATYLMQDVDFTKKDKCTGKKPEKSVPASIDWTTQGAVTGVKNQGQCGSCWAFSTTGSLEGAYKISAGSLTSFSQQQLVDCSSAYGNHGCNGGLMDDAFYYVQDQGITLESKYPYKGVGGKCTYTSADKAWTISDCYDVKQESEDDLRSAIAAQPVSVAIQANQIGFQLYKKGVFGGACGHKLDHGVLAVGYGQQDGKKFWKIKNSWGAAWGQSGYIRFDVSKGGKYGQCGIYMAASIPLA